MSNLSRRSLVASAAALPALAVPAVAEATIGSARPDPIFAAIDYQQQAQAVVDAVCAGDPSDELLGSLCETVNQR